MTSVHPKEMAPVDDRWSAWHLHPEASSPGNLDELLTSVVRPVVAAASGPAFFIRYWQSGTHVRLRIRDLTHAEQQNVGDELRERLRCFNDDHPGPRMDPAQYAAHVRGVARAGEGGVSMEVGTLRDPGCYVESYRPETQRYGGQQVMELSEDLFCTSSRVVLDFLSTRPALSARKLLPLRFLGSATSLLDPSDRSAFLTRGEESWRDWLHASGHQIRHERIATAARRTAAALRAAGIDPLRDPATPGLAPFLKQLEDALPYWRGGQGGVLASHAHMLFNRLGVPTIDELLTYTILKEFLTVHETEEREIA